jgi:Uma2 family endonuclease
MMGKSVKILPHYTYNDYCKWEGRWEIIDGIPFAMNLEYQPRHQLLATNIGAEFGIALKSQRFRELMVSQPVDYKITENTVVQPDVLIYKGKTDNAYLTTTPKLIVEITSPTSEIKDRHTKFHLYESAGVKWFLLINPETEIVQVFELQNGQYVLKSEGHSFSFPFSLEEGCNIEIDFNEIW